MKYKEWKKDKFYSFRSKIHKIGYRKQKRCRNCLGDAFPTIVNSRFIHWFKHHRSI